jgi:uncharacterized protein YjbI with pentapeptide repeats
LALKVTAGATLVEEELEEAGLEEAELEEAGLEEAGLEEGTLTLEEAPLAAQEAKRATLRRANGNKGVFRFMIFSF